MLNKINGINRAGETGRAAPTKGDQAARLAADAGVTSRAVDPPSSQILAMVAEIAVQPPPVDAGRIAQLRTAITSGDYGINLTAIALGIANSVKSDASA